MVLKKKRLAMVAIITVVLLLAACGGKGAASDNPVYNSGGPQDASPDDILPISKALKKHDVWLGISTYEEEDISRDTEIDFVYVFKIGKVKYYDYREYVKENNPATIGEVTIPKLVDDHLSIEDVVNMSDKEIVKHAEKNAVEEINLGEYSLNVLLDDTGNNPEREELITQTKLEETISFQESITKEFFGTYFQGMKTSNLPTGDTPIAGFLFTRTDDSPFGFRLDSPDTKGKNVTIEGK